MSSWWSRPPGGRAEGDPGRDPRRRHLGRGLRRDATAGVLPCGHGARRRGRHVRGHARAGQGSPAVAAPGRGRAARARAGRGVRRGDGQCDQLQHGLVGDLRAGPDVRFSPQVRADLSADQAPRPAVPRRRLGPVRRCAADRTGRTGLAPRGRGRRPLPVRRAGEPGRPRRHDARPGAAHLGIRDELRRPRRDRARQVQPADAEARPPDLGGVRVPGPGQLHGVPPARLAQRRGHEAG